MKLLEFQKSSTEHIVKYFENHDAYLLADETGLGKTVIASAVTKKQAAKKAGQFKVVYIASNLALAKKNAAEKLCGEIVETDRLSMVWKALENTDTAKEQKILLFPITPEVSLKQNTQGERHERAQCLKKYHKITKQAGHKPANKLTEKLESSIGNLETFLSGSAVTEPDEPESELYSLYKTAVKTFKSVTFTQAQKGTRYRDFELSDDPRKAADELALLLLDMYINLAIRDGDISSYRTLQSVIDKCVHTGKKNSADTAESVELEKDMPGSNIGDVLGSFYSNVDLEQYTRNISSLKNSIDETVRYLLFRQYIKNIRTYMSYYSLKQLRPDLVIIDEIQNYPEIFNDEKPSDERAVVVKLVIDTLLGKYNTESETDTKVLMLSATPYAYKNAVEPEGDRENDDETDELGEFTRHLVGLETILNYMGSINCGKNAAAEITALWKDSQVLMRELASARAVDKARFGELEKKINELSKKMRVIGISRSERPIHGYEPDEGRLTLPIDSIDPAELTTFFKKNNKALKTRLALSLPRDTKPDNLSRTYASLKDAKNTSDGYVRSSRIKALLSDIMEGDSYLWLFVPPCKPSRKLNGVFKGHKSSHGKTLLFSAYSVVPESLKKCIEDRLDKKLREYFEEHFKGQSFDKLLNSIGAPNDLCSVFKENYKGTDDDSKMLASIFSSQHAKKILLAVYGDRLIKDYPECVRDYCKDGCFDDVLAEYKFLRDSKKNAPTLSEHIGSFEKVSYCDCYNGTDGDDLIGRIDRFNTPFYPFVFLLTSVAEEGFDFHWYCDRIVHWNAPSSPIALLQREGRVDRINSMSVRKTIAKKTDTNISWDDMIEEYKTKFPGNEYKGMFPNFWAGPESERIHRYCYYYPYSSDHFRWELLIRSLEYYRSMFGASEIAIDNDEVRRKLTRLRLDISV